MDASRFDEMVRSWAEAGSRRSLLTALAGGAAALTGMTETSGKRKKKKKKVTLCLNGQTITVPKKQQGGYLSQGATVGKCPAACVRQCSGRTCGQDGCGGTYGDCSGDLTCQGGTCSCPAGEDECAPGVCVPTGSLCCTDFHCDSGERCIHGQCVTWQGTCPAGVNTCAQSYSCNSSPTCYCYQSTEGESRCSGGPDLTPTCNVCQTTADCVEQFPDVPGVFCVNRGGGTGCCPGVCARPCPSA
jgi:hypothetical protein